MRDETCIKEIMVCFFVVVFLSLESALIVNKELAIAQRCYCFTLIVAQPQSRVLVCLLTVLKTLNCVELLCRLELGLSYGWPW